MSRSTSLTRHAELGRNLKRGMIVITMEPRTLTMLLASGFYALSFAFIILNESYFMVRSSRVLQRG